jgi:hypothetical protein
VALRLDPASLSAKSALAVLTGAAGDPSAVQIAYPAGTRENGYAPFALRCWRTGGRRAVANGPASTKRISWSDLRRVR